MQVKYYNDFSLKLNKNMEFKIYGSSGKPMIVFPSSGGRFFEYEDFGMISACRPLIDSGKIRVVTVDSVDRESWLDYSKSPVERARRYNDYDAYITGELIPFIVEETGWSGPMIATGCSMGGYHAANFFFRHPDLFDTVISLSGVYDLRFFAGDCLHEPEVYINSPVDYLKNMEDSWYLDRYRRGEVILCTGLGNWEEESIKDTANLQNIMRLKGIHAWVDYWGYDVHHDWDWWRKQISYFLGTLIDKGKL